MGSVCTLGLNFFLKPVFVINITKCQKLLPQLNEENNFKNP